MTDLMNGKKSSFPKRGEIYWVNLDPTVGQETKKTRPGLIISNDIGNEIANILIVAPITSKVKTVYPFEVKISLNGKLGKVMLNQCRAIDKSRILNKLAQIDEETLARVESALKIVFSLT